MKYKIVTGKELFKLLEREVPEPIIVDKDFLVVETDYGILVYDTEYEDFFGGYGVFVVTKNVDFIEGRGPMVFHKVFTYSKDAIEYVMSQSGIYGSKQGISNYPGISIHGTPYCISGFNGYDIKPTILE